MICRCGGGAASGGDQNRRNLARRNSDSSFVDSHENVAGFSHTAKLRFLQHDWNHSPFRSILMHRRARFIGGSTPESGGG
ncbi:hypothetical protein Y032_0004g1988 [Ancylostoma ceylanicum]|uniref:Uncharacterized protein n=1 Tax=Ancylostoma ceylanicum TaxID=53326 RepID=A0A016VVV8_9BILA|nr:hypothetical protein Y032_0004g1988 [Ancylostoma ceylanicum]